MPVPFTVTSPSTATFSRTVIVRRASIVALRDPHLKGRASHPATYCAASEFVSESLECVIHVVLLCID
ncbi:hypothetical protein NY08_1122 [Rhodococcus sp. B7740]|nr:hypothetical protein NY08_1122 [Rhodococcus sp. B7740]